MTPNAASVCVDNPKYSTWKNEFTWLFGFCRNVDDVDLVSFFPSIGVLLRSVMEWTHGQSCCRISTDILLYSVQYMVRVYRQTVSSFL